MKAQFRKSFVHAALALGLLGSPLAATAGALLSSTAAHAETAPTLEEMKQTLAQYGQFFSSEKYGEVWKPTVTPPGWHPYPACDWVYTKSLGWYFNDKTAWGQIVHHYGRWMHDEKEGWLWVPGTEFSPGWVTWKVSEDWVGWAPTMPDVDMTKENLVKFDDDKLWIFMDAKKFGNDCSGVGTTAQYPAFFGNTSFVTDITFVNGIGVIVLPPVFVGPFVDVNINVFAPWSKTFIGTWIWNWNNVFNDIDIVINVSSSTCTPNDPGGNQPNDPGRDPNNSKPRSFTPITQPPAPPSMGRTPPRFIPQVPGRQVPQRRVEGFQPLPDDVVVDRYPGRRPGGFGGRRPVDQGFVPGRNPGGRQPGHVVDGGRQIDPGFIRGDRGRGDGGLKHGGRGAPSFVGREGGPQIRGNVARNFGGREITHGGGRTFERFSRD